jgi:diguanylate cyclase (GGDEF)-like protein
MINLILPDQLQELHALGAILASVPDRESAGRTLVARLAAILDVPALLIERRAGAWQTMAEERTVPAAGVIGDAWQAAARAAGADRLVVTDVALADRERWTCLTLRTPGGKPLVLAFAGDWTLSEKLLAEFADTLSKALEPVMARPAARLNSGMTAAYALARRLARTNDRAQLYQLIVNACARAVGAKKASLAVYDEDVRALVITATCGYPAILVKHLRFPSGVGIIGSVFLARRPLRVDDIRTQLDLGKPRLRYSTPSFMSVPLLGVGGALGVVSVADQRDAQPFERRDLGTLRGLAGVAALALDRMRAIERSQTVAREAAIDTLTGLFNRRHFMLRLDEELERARRQGAPLTAVMLDVDNFKQLNDRLGHPGGDAVLRVIGDVLRRSVRLFDICARFGGDEFAILMPGSSSDSSAQIAERIREDLEGSRPPIGPWSDDLKVTASIGIATGTGASGEDLIARADEALYAAKREGKNRVRLSP